MLKKKEKEKEKVFSIYLKIGNIEVGPPLSTLLGNYGVNTVKFVKDLTDYLQGLPNYFLVKVVITIKEDKTYIFKVNELTTSTLLRLAIKKKTMLVKEKGRLNSVDMKVLHVRDIFVVCFLRFGKCDDNLLKVIFGSICSMNVLIVND